MNDYTLTIEYPEDAGFDVWNFIKGAKVNRPNSSFIASL